MNPIDRVILFMAPARGVTRLKARAAAKVLMNYDAASKGRRTYGWKAPGTTADSAAFGARQQLRALARDMVRNRAWAARGRDVVVANVVGTGIIPSVDANDEGTAEAIKALIKSHLMTAAIDTLGVSDLTMLQATIMKGVFTDGEILVRRRIRDTRLNPDLPLPFQLELIEADQLDHAVTTWGQNQVIEGCEYGPTGRIEAYHILNEHPGSLTYRTARKSTRVDARDIAHVRRIDRPGQLRGVTWLAPVMMTLGELSDYQEAQILKQRMAALMAVVLEGEAGAAGEADPGTLDKLEPGAVVKAPAGWTAKFTAPPAVDGYDQFMREGLRACAMGLGVTYESLSGNLSDVNLASGRMGRMEMDRLVEMWQDHVMIQQFCAPVGRWMKEAIALKAMRKLRDFDLDWTGPKRALIDPVKEIPPILKKIEAGLSSRQREQRQLGLDPQAVLRERIEDAAAETAANLAPAAPPVPPAA